MKLEDTLKEFESKGGLTSREIKLNETPEEFKEIAQSILSGYFEVTSNVDKTNVVKVIPTTVELYYFEERGKNNKDVKVYHRNEKAAKSRFNPRLKNKYKDIPYFNIGDLNAHQSGVDITFESEKHGFRASALIREFKILNGKNIAVVDLRADKDDRSTYFYYALLSQINIFEGFRINWKDGDEAIEITEGKPRKNIEPKYPWSFSAKE